MRAGGTQQSFPGLCRTWGGGRCNSKYKMNQRTTISLDRESEGTGTKGWAFFFPLFFFLGEYNVMNSARGPAPPFNILSAKQGFLWQPGEPGEP